MIKRTLFDETHDMFRQTVATFIQREVVPNFPKWEQQGIVDRSFYHLAGKAGLLGMAVPTEYGGGGTDDFRHNVIITEEFARAGVMNAGQGVFVHNDSILPYFLKLATAEQRQRWLPGLCTGKLLAAIAMTEPNAGSDLQAVARRAEKDGSSFVLNGSKQFISNGINSDLVIVVCRTRGLPDDPPKHCLSLLVVEAGMDGFKRGRNLSKVGQHAADTAELFFTDVHIPAANVLGEEGRAFYHLMDRLTQERLAIASQAVAHAVTAFGWTLEYTKQRRAFGQPIATFQNSRFVLASMRTELDIAQVFLDRQIEAHLAGELDSEDAAECKWWCAELNKRVLDSCLQLHGGYGYMEEFPIARAWRDGRVLSIYGGTTEIMKEIIGHRKLGI